MAPRDRSASDRLSKLRAPRVPTAVALALVLAALASAADAAGEAAATPVASLLAVGDTGAPPGSHSILGGQRAVAAGLAHEDARSPVAALLLLGDNFYESGLRSGELVSRVRGNVVVPYCRFLDLSAPRSAEVRSACADGEARRPAPKLLAVLGNHDVSSLESRENQSREIAQFVANWELSEAPATWVELAPRLSLVLFDSNRLRSSGDRAPLREALRAAPGPWRILAAHHPVGTSGDGGAADSYADAVREAVREAGVPVQLMLAGHEHNLQVVALDDPGPRLVVVSGAGSRPRPVETSSRSRIFSFEGLGFSRVDLLATPEGERLQATLFAAPRWGALLGLPPEVLGRWSVDEAETLQVEPLAAREPATP